MKFRISLDALGITASLACAIHCAVLPLFVASLPLFGINIIENHAFEFGMIALAFVIGIYALWHGYRRHHHSVLPMILFSIGIGSLILKQVFHDYHHILLIPGVLFIVGGHYFNYRLCRQHNHAHADDCDHDHY